jgi:hypothetical protein
VLLEHGVSLDILQPPFRFAMERPINLDEVDNITFNRNLPAELPAFEPSVPQLAPQACFQSSLFAPELPGKGAFLRINPVTRH